MKRVLANLLLRFFVIDTFYYFFAYLVLIVLLSETKLRKLHEPQYKFFEYF